MNSEQKLTKKKQLSSDCLIAIRIRGTVGLHPKIEHTLQLLRLIKIYNAIILENKPELIGMLRTVKDFITWGEINQESLDAIIMKRGRAQGNKKISDEFIQKKLGFKSIGELSNALLGKKISLNNLWDSGIKPVFRLHPPKGGFKKSTKRSFKSHGELGYRGEDVNKLLRRMI